MTGKPLRVLHCPGAAGWFPGSLARAERALGLESWAVAFGSSEASLADEILFEDGASRFVRERRRWSLLRRALREFDIVHFNYGSSLMPQRHMVHGGRVGTALYRLYAGLLEQRDLVWLRRAGKGIVITYQGDDARQADRVPPVDGIDLVSETGPEYYPPGSDDQKRRRIRRAGELAHTLYALTPDLLALLPASAKYLPTPVVDLEDWLPVAPPGRDKPLIVHAPSHRGVKGTRFLLEAVAELEREGVPFDLELVEGRSREEARRIYEQADLVVDQLLLGWYGGVAVEAMALGKPTVAYLSDAALAAVPEEQGTGLPVIGATPSTILDVLRSWLTERRSELPELGRRARAFVERWHDPAEIAARVAADYRAILERGAG